MILSRLRSIGLKWKLLIPFLFFAFCGTTTMAVIGLGTQQRLIEGEERKEVAHLFWHFLEEVKTSQDQVRSLALMIASNPEVQRLFAQRDREGLLRFLLPTFTSLEGEFDIGYFHFHTPPATSFLRLHFPEKWGDPMEGFRKTILDAIEKKEAVAGLEMGALGFGIRGVAPVHHQGTFLGTVEIGRSFGARFLEMMRWTETVALALYERTKEGDYVLMASAGTEVDSPFIASLKDLPPLEEPLIAIAPQDLPHKSVLLGPVTDYSGNLVGILEIVVDRSHILKKLMASKHLMILVGIGGIALSFALTFVVAHFFTKPIEEIVSEAREIALERRERHLEPRPMDEMGRLTLAINVMLDAMKQSRLEIEEHARTLERRVEERTADLVASMENYRTLVEHVPLLVYRILEDGTLEFINSYLTESLGYSIEEAVGDKAFWVEKIWQNDLSGYEGFVEVCFKEGLESRGERSVLTKDGRSLTFLDHAIPRKGENGGICWVDGIMMDISELKTLQEEALRTEEIKLLGEISARMAHEIRNPLAAAGGFARRLLDALPPEDTRRRMAVIVVDEVARIEDFLKILFASIKPFDLTLASLDLNALLDEKTVLLRGMAGDKGILFQKGFAPELPEIRGDAHWLGFAFENLLRHALLVMPKAAVLKLTTTSMKDHVRVVFRHPLERFSDEDIAQFFFPRLGDSREGKGLDLPLAKIVIHRHRGRIQVCREEPGTLKIVTTLPLLS